jgi:archaemetzincin
VGAEEGPAACRGRQQLTGQDSGPGPEERRTAEAEAQSEQLEDRGEDGHEREAGRERGVAADPARELRWRGALPLGLFTGEHAYVITGDETGSTVAVPRAGDDPARGQHLAAPFLAALKAALPKGAPPPDAAIFVTDVDLYRPQTDGAFGEIDARGKVAVLSVRRLREAFYKRKADPAKQRSRLVKMILFALGRIRGLTDCRDPQCVMAAMSALADVDGRSERYCAACWKYFSTGAFRI